MTVEVDDDPILPALDPVVFLSHALLLVLDRVVFLSNALLLVLDRVVFLTNAFLLVLDRVVLVVHGILPTTEPMHIEQNSAWPGKYGLLLGDHGVQPGKESAGLVGDLPWV